MNINLHLLLGTNRLNSYEKAIRTIFSETLSKIQEKMPIHDVDIVMYDNPEGTVPEQGIGGYTPNAHLIYISLDPTFPDLLKSINTELKRTLAHELHHTLRWENPGYGENLLDAIITEGLADHFDLEMFNESPQPWSVAFTEQELAKQLEKAKEEFENKDYDHFAWFYGNEELGIPRWIGYSLGYKLVKDYLEKHPNKKPSTLYNVKTSEFLKSEG